MLEHTEATNEVAVLPAPVILEIKSSRISDAEWQRLVEKVTQEARTLANSSSKSGFVIGAKVFALYLVVTTVLGLFINTLPPDSVTKSWMARAFSYSGIFFFFGGFALWVKRVESLKAGAVTELVSTGDIRAIPVLLDALKAHRSLVFDNVVTEALPQLLPALNKENRDTLQPAHYAKMVDMMRREASIIQKMKLAEPWIQAMGRIEYVEAIPIIRKIARFHAWRTPIKERCEVLSRAAQEVLPGLEAVASREKAEKVLLRPSQPEAKGETLLRPVPLPIEHQPETLLRPSAPEGEDEADDTDNS